MNPLIIGAIVAVLLIIIIGIWYAVSTQQAQADADAKAARDAAAAKLAVEQAAAAAEAARIAAIPVYCQSNYDSCVRASGGYGSSWAVSACTAKKDTCMSNGGNWPW